MTENSISLNKYISQSGRCSRREADKLIEAGRVKLNGEIAKKGNRVEKGDTVLLDDKALNHKPKAVYLALNKPPGITCTTDLKDEDNIIDFINYPERIFPIGRLDKPSSGLIFLTNDGDIVNKILRVENNHQKEYVVTVDKPVTNEFLEGMRNGVRILGTKTKKCQVSKTGRHGFKIILTQGLNRQIRRMCEHFNFRVKTLKRTRIMSIKLGTLRPGDWRLLTEEEVAGLKGKK